jgi:hypothetical protein
MNDTLIDAAAHFLAGFFLTGGVALLILFT